MRVLVNLSNIKVGGGLQASIALLEELARDSRDIDWFFVLSENVNREVKHIEFITSRAVVITLRPFNAISCFKARRSISKVAKDFAPNAVFSLFGPVYWSPPDYIPHLVGFANAWLVKPKKEVYSIYRLPDRIIQRLKNSILRFAILVGKSFFVTEVEWMKDQISTNLLVDRERIFVVYNSICSQFSKPMCPTHRIIHIEKNESVYKFITISHNYPHKNLRLIEYVAPLLDRDGFDVKFYITFPPEEYDKQSETFKKYTVNLGVLSPIQCMPVYKQCDALFLPSVIECFTASYLEAMAVGLPILTSDRKFAREVCGDSGIYFEPLNQHDVYTKLKEHLLTIRSEGVKELDYQYYLNRFGTIETKVNSYVKCLDKITQKAGHCA